MGARSRLLILWFCCTAFVVYVTTLPFNFVPSLAHAGERLSAISWDPFVSPGRRRPSITDMAQNVILFVPFGALTMALARKKQVGTALLITTAAGATLSLGVEAIQLFTIDRTSSLNDVVTNTGGAFLGAAVVAGTRSLAGRHLVIPLPERLVAAAYPMLLWGVVLVIAAWQPFDADMGVREVGSKVFAFIEDPWQAGVFAEEGVDSLRYGLFAAAAAAWCRAAAVPRPMLCAAGAGVLLACGLELSQFFVDSRMPGVKDMTVGAAGTMAGVLIARRGSPLTGAGAGALAVGALAATALMLWSPLELATEHRPLNWLPFHAFQRRSTDQAAAHAIELTLAFIPFGFATARLLPRHAWAMAVGCAVPLAFLLEYAQGFFVDRYADVTDVLFMAIGAAAGAAAAGPMRAAFTRSVAASAHDRGADTPGR